MMARTNESDLLAYDLEYEDGRKVVMLVNRYHIQGSDAVATAIARERQERGALAPGKIISVKRRM